MEFSFMKFMEGKKLFEHIQNEYSSIEIAKKQIEEKVKQLRVSESGLVKKLKDKEYSTGDPVVDFAILQTNRVKPDSLEPYLSLKDTINENVGNIALVVKEKREWILRGGPGNSKDRIVPSSYHLGKISGPLETVSKHQFILPLENLITTKPTQHIRSWEEDNNPIDLGSTKEYFGISSPNITAIHGELPKIKFYFGYEEMEDTVNPLFKGMLAHGYKQLGVDIPQDLQLWYQDGLRAAKDKVITALVKLERAPNKETYQTLYEQAEHLGLLKKDHSKMLIQGEERKPYEYIAKLESFVNASMALNNQ